MPILLAMQDILPKIAEEDHDRSFIVIGKKQKAKLLQECAAWCGGTVSTYHGIPIVEVDVVDIGPVLGLQLK